MTYERPRTAQEFLSIRHVLAEADNTFQLERLDEQLQELAASNPGMAVEILEALSLSDDLGAKEAAAIYTRFLFHTRPEETTELLIALFDDTDSDIKSRVLDTIDVITSDNRLTPTQAAHLITEVKPKKLSRIGNDRNKACPECGPSIF